MKQGIANIWLLGMIVVFIAMFAAYIITTINYSKSFKMKNEMLTIIEKHHGMTCNNGVSGKSIIDGSDVTVDVGAIQTINLYLRGTGYTQKGKCPSRATDNPGTWYGVKTLSETGQFSDFAEEITGSTADNKYYWCFAKYDAQIRTRSYSSAYYKVRMFYGFDVPVLSTFLAVNVDGMTDEIFDIQDEDTGIKTSSESYDNNGNST